MPGGNERLDTLLTPRIAVSNTCSYGIPMGTRSRHINARRRMQLFLDHLDHHTHLMHLMKLEFCRMAAAFADCNRHEELGSPQRRCVDKQQLPTERDGSRHVHRDWPISRSQRRAPSHSDPTGALDRDAAPGARGCDCNEKGSTRVSPKSEARHQDPNQREQPAPCEGVVRAIARDIPPSYWRTIAAAPFLNMYFWIFPVAVFGSSVTNVTP